MKSVLITGVAGFIGSKLANRFIMEGFHVVGVDDLSVGKIDNVPDGVDFIQGDLSKSGTFKHIPKCNIVLHLAGQSSGELSFKNPQADLEKNTLSTLNLINYSIANQVEKFVFASSMSVYGNQDLDSVHEGMNAKPLSCYGVSKLASEGYLRVFQHKLPFVVFRMFNVYGPGQDMANLSQGMVSIYLSQAIRNKRIIIKGSYERFRDFIYIDDVVDSWFDVSTNHEVKNVTLNLGTGVKTTVRDLIEMIKSLLPDLEIKIEAGTDGDQFGLFSNNTLYSSLIGVNDFTPLNIGLREFIIWAKQELN